MRSDGRYEKHNRKNERKPCKNSRQPSGMKDIRKPDSRDRVALMKHLAQEKAARLRFVWRCHGKYKVVGFRSKIECRGKSRNAYTTRSAAKKAAATHRCKGKACIEIVDLKGG